MFPVLNQLRIGVQSYSTLSGRVEVHVKFVVKSQCRSWVSCITQRFAGVSVRVRMWPWACIQDATTEYTSDILEKWSQDNRLQIRIHVYAACQFGLLIRMVFSFMVRARSSFVRDSKHGHIEARHGEHTSLNSR